MDIGSRQAPATVRHDGWTAQRQFGFLEVLADGGNVAQAAATVGMSASSAYRLRGREPSGAFAAGWQTAQAMAYYRLRDIALDRAENGTEMALAWRGEVVATRRVFSDRLLLGLLDHLRPAPAGPDAPRREDPNGDFGKVIEAYASALERGTDPVRPHLSGDTAQNKPLMTRAEFIAALAPMRTRADPDDDASCVTPPSPSDDAGVNFA